MNEDKMQQDGDVRVQHKNIQRIWGISCLQKKAGNEERDNASVDDVPLNFQIHKPFTF